MGNISEGKYNSDYTGNQADAAIGAVLNSKEDWDAAVVEARQAQSTADTARTEAQNAQATANTANSKAEEALNDLNNLDGYFAELDYRGIVRVDRARVVYLDSIYQDTVPGHVYYHNGYIYEVNSGAPFRKCVKGVVYIDKNTLIHYEWNGSELVEIGEDSPSSGNSGVSVSISGNVVTMHINPSADTPMLSMSANTLDFGDVESGKSKVIPIAVSGKNLSDSVTLSVSGSAFGLSTSSDGNFSQSIVMQLSASGKVSQTVYLRFAPASLGAASATVTATSGTLTRELAFTGQGVAQVVPTISLSAQTNSITFDTVGQQVTQSFTVSGRNLEGDIALSVSASGNGSASLSVNSVSESEASSGKVVTVTYTPADLNGDTLTVTATSANATTQTLQFTASNVERMATGSTFDYDLFTFTVLDDRSTVSVKYKSLGTGKLVIPATAYDGNNVPYRVIEVEESGFEGKTGITSVTFEDNGVEIIRNRGFAACNGITSVKFPNTLTHIGVSGNTFAFSSTKITSLSLPSSLKFIGQSAFYNSTSLETITINGMVSSSNGGTISNGAFTECSGLKTVISKISLSGVSSWSSVLPSIGGTGTFPKISGINAFGFGSSDSPTYIKLLVPDSDSVTAYANAGYWGCFKDIRLEE